MTEPQEPKRPQTGETTPLTSDLADRIARAERERQVAEKAGEVPAVDLSGWNRGMRLGSEFVAAILVGVGMGWLLDMWLKTTPWLMLVMMMFGFAAGVLNVIRSAAEMNKAANPPSAVEGAPKELDE